MRILFTIVFMDILGFGIIIPMFPLLKELYQLNEISVGLLASSFFFASIFGSIILGYLSDKFGRKNILIISLIGLVISYGASGFIHTFDHRFNLFVLLRFLCGFFSGSMAVSFAAGSNLSSDKDLLKNMGLLGGAFSAGFILGPSIGGIALSLGDDIKFPFYATASAYAVCLFIAIFFFKEPTYNKNEEASAILPAIKEILTDKNIMLFIMLFIILSICITGLEVLFLTYVLGDKLQLSPFMIGMVWTYFAIVSTIIQIFICKYIKPSIAVVGGFTLWAISIFMLSFIANIYETLIVVTLIAISLGLLFTNINAHLALSGNDKQQGTIFGVNFTAEAIGGSIGPSLLGYILFITNNLIYVWGAIALLCIICATLAFFYYRNSSMHPKNI